MGERDTPARQTNFLSRFQQIGLTDGSLPGAAEGSGSLSLNERELKWERRQRDQRR